MSTIAPYIIAADAVTRISDATAPMLGAEVTAFLAASSGNQLAALAKASDKIDRVRWQGRKLIYNQDREFPRVAVDSSAPGLFGTGLAGPFGLGFGETIWDWDWTNNVAVVPDLVIQAVIIQAGSEIIAARNTRLDTIHDGVKGARSGSMSEDYDRTAPGITSRLCGAAWELLERYRLMSGRIV